jgi:hypothetical protein
VAEAPSDKTIGGPTRGRGVLDVIAYSVARLLLVVLVTGGIYGLARLIGVADFPLVVAALGGLIISMPLGIWVFSPLRRRATAALAVAGEQRRRERDELRARLRGEVASAQESDGGPHRGPEENRDAD